MNIALNSGQKRETLLKILIGMAVKGYAYDPVAARTPTAVEISGDLIKLGISVTDDTIRKYLNEAKALISIENLKDPD